MKQSMTIAVDLAKGVLEMTQSSPARRSATDSRHFQQSMRILRRDQKECSRRTGRRTSAPFPFLQRTN